MQSEHWHFNVGVFECTVVKDGAFPYPPANDGRALEPERWQAYSRACLSLVINTGKHRILVDTGAGNMAPTTGHLIPNLRATGITPADIDIVLLTHGHPGHIGGNLDQEGKPAFPRALYMMWQAEWEFWMNGPDVSSMHVDDEVKCVLMTNARINLPPLENQLSLIEEEMEIVPGIHAIAVPGHTPGHIAVAVSSGEDYLLCLADTAIHPRLLQEPAWDAGIDLMPEQALASRCQILDWAVTEHALVHLSHFSWPGLGHIIQKENAWQWQPVEFMEEEL